MSGIYYHASKYKYEINKVLSITDYEGDCTYDHNVRSEEQRRVNEIIDSRRPKHVAISRTKAIYLFDNLCNCRDYAKSILHEDDVVYIYKVQIEGQIYGGYPFCMIKEVYNKLHSHKCLDCCISSYWLPRYDWKVLEYMSDKIKIVGYEDPIGFSCGYASDDISRIRAVCKKCQLEMQKSALTSGIV